MIVGRLEHPFFGRRLTGAAFFSLVMLSLLVLRLWYLQAVQGTHFRDLSENNRIRSIRTVAARGSVYDREGRVLVGNRPAFQVAIVPEDTPSVKDAIALIAQVTGRSVEELTKNFETQRSRYHFEPKVIISDASREELAKVKVNSFRLPGVIVEVVPTRDYPFRNAASQLVGYSREISKSQLDKLGKDGYKRGDMLGQTGLEGTWEPQLRGKSGFRQVEVDAMGHRIGDRTAGGELPGLPGKDLHLTLDLDLQRAAEEGLGAFRGAVVALDPNNGDVLALVSTPTYDANVFSGQVSSEAWRGLIDDANDPLQNRALSMVYPPGSTFKLVTSLAALAEGKATEHTELNCPGYYKFGNRRYHCHKRSGHGGVSLRRALLVSCNAFYFQLGQQLGIQVMERYGKMLGLGAQSGIELPGEVPGIMPSEDWKKKQYKERWYPGDTLPVSIGQGYVVVTPIQMAVLAATLANDGIVYKPRLVQRVVDRLTGEQQEIPPTVVRKLDIKPEVFALVRSIAAGVVSDPHGTGKASKLPGISVGGKTGTAQVGRLGKESLGERFRDHAWFVSFAPVEKPMLAVSVIVENSGHGGQFAAPIAKKVYEAFFRKKGMLPPEVVGEGGTGPAGPTEADTSEGTQEADGVVEEEAD
ncbi:MAG: penicillin-binding protein 2 [Deltaproteobacteria bacterium]|nr:penicillin-binding protein 2 [Deltaproteobacteria bacterium]